MPLILLVCVGVTVGHAANFHGLSLDVPHHYALVATLMSDWHFGAEPLPNLGEMNYYPNLSHRIAALVGTFLGSGLIGLHVVALVSMVAVWSVIGALLSEFGEIAGVLAGAVLLILVPFAGSGSVHGDEIFSNFFFAQVTAEAGAFASIWIFYRLTLRGRLSVRNLVLPVLVYMVAWAHLLPALKLVAALGVLVTRECFMAWRGRQTFPWAAVTSVVACVAVVLTHPSLSAMSRISEGDGVLSFAYPSDFATLLGFAGTVAILSAAFLILSVFKDGMFPGVPRLPLAVLGSLGIAVSALLILQMLALVVAGFGSPYAVKKHMFGIYSLLLIDMAVLSGITASTIVRTKAGLLTFGASAQRLAAAALPAVLAAGIFWLMVPTPVYTVPQVIPLQEFARNYLAFHSPAQDQGQSLFVRADVPPVINYLVSTADLLLPRGATATRIQKGERITKESDAFRVITNPGNPFFDRPDCRNGTFANSSNVVVDLECVWSIMNAPVGPGSSFGFTASDIGPSLLQEGWSIPESWGTWSIGNVAVLAVPRPHDGRQSIVRLMLRGFVPSESDPVEVTVRVDGQEVDRLSLSAEEKQVTIRVSGNIPEAGGPAMVRFDITNPRSPKELGLSSDIRSIGVGLRSLSYE